ncbi:uncharacterized protein LOC131843371 [Achroia grisella]|uniref:uncharacterized protein LOC131843371 n=1 Tax=Achroia grisella TaxID=688607 RepID=UPI0027D2B073|nr:uncharacterized protein LOC131843371 [Achroia grisella]
MASHNVPTTSQAESLCHSRGSSIVDVVDRICVDDGDAACSLRSVQSKSRVSSSSVKARRAAVEAAYKRRQYEREAMLAQRLSEVEDAEFRAEIEQINADADCEGSRRSRSTCTRMRTQQWRTLHVYKTCSVAPHEKPSHHFSSLQKIPKRSCAHSNVVLRHPR